MRLNRMEMEIEVINMPNALDVIKTAAIAKTSYHSESYIELIDSLDFEEASKFLKGLIKKGHETTIEPLIFTFNLTGVSRVLTHQLRTYRIGSFMQKSLRRKRDLTIDNFVYPKKTKHMAKYEYILGELIKAYNWLVEHGEDPDDARRILPIGITTEITWTVNARALRNFLRQRLKDDANWEIKRFARDVVLLLIDADLGFLLSDIAEEFNKRDQRE
jgi:thymidylate synthase (FAD)